MKITHMLTSIQILGLKNKHYMSCISESRLNFCRICPKSSWIVKFDQWCFDSFSTVSEKTPNWYRIERCHRSDFRKVSGNCPNWYRKDNFSNRIDRCRYRIDVNFTELIKNIRKIVISDCISNINTGFLCGYLFYFCNGCTTTILQILQTLIH